MEKGKIKRKEIPFSQVSNSAIRDTELSLKAKGLYVLIQSYITIPNFVLYKTTLMKQCKESKNTFDSAWKELKDKGYLIQYKHTDKVKKTFYYDYELLDIKQEATTQKAIPGKASTWESGLYINTDLNNIDLNNTYKTNINESFNNDLGVRYNSKEEFMKEISKYTKNIEYIKSLDIIYNYFLENIKVNHYKLNKEQIEKMFEGIRFIFEVIEKWNQLEIILDYYFELDNKYYSIQQFTNLNTLAFIFSKTGIHEEQRFNIDGFDSLYG